MVIRHVRYSIQEWPSATEHLGSVCKPPLAAWSGVTSEIARYLALFFDHLL